MKKTPFNIKRKEVEDIDIPYTSPLTFSWVNLVETLIKSQMLTHNDIPVFEFRPLEEVGEMLLEAGYSQEDIDGTISGLSEIPLDNKV